MIDDDVTNPVADNNVVPAQEVAAQPEPDDLELADDLLEDVDAEEEYAEVEREGKRYRVPKALEKDLLLHADYTRKTQKTAERERELDTRETLIKQRAEFQEAFSTDLAKFHNVQDELAKYEKVDWNTLFQSNPNEANRLQFQYSQLKDQRDNLGRELNQKQQQRQLDEQQETAKRIEQGRAELAKRIPNWSPETARKVSDFAVKTYGFTADEVGSIVDPRAVEALYHASIGKQFLERQRAQLAKPQQPEAQPVPQVGAKRTAPTVNLYRITDPEKWAEVRNKQEAAKRRR